MYEYVSILLLSRKILSTFTEIFSFWRCWNISAVWQIFALSWCLWVFWSCRSWLNFCFLVFGCSHWFFVTFSGYYFLRLLLLIWLIAFRIFLWSFCWLLLRICCEFNGRVLRIFCSFVCFCVGNRQIWSCRRILGLSRRRIRINRHTWSCIYIARRSNRRSDSRDTTIDCSSCYFSNRRRTSHNIPTQRSNCSNQWWTSCTSNIIWRWNDWTWWDVNIRDFLCGKSYL